MIAGLDHVICLVRDLDAAVAGYRLLLAREPAWRAAPDGAATALFTFPNAAIELLAADGDGESAARIRAALDTQGEGLASLCFRVRDIVATHRRLGRVALAPEDVGDGASTDIASGGTLRWQRTRAATAASHGVRLFFLAMAGERPASQPLGDAAAEGLDHVVIDTQHPERAAALYGARLGLDMALDRSHPAWGRLMFFRCGDAVVEIVQRSGATDESARDRLSGLCWRVPDIAAARDRLGAAGVAVSQVRPGRKPGTQVMTVTSHTSGVPTLLLQRAPR